MMRLKHCKLVILESTRNENLGIVELICCYLMLNHGVEAWREIRSVGRREEGQCQCEFQYYQPSGTFAMCNKIVLSSTSQNENSLVHYYEKVSKCILLYATNISS